ncbi:MAG: hypothetical protein K6E38_03620 [Fretibacterium sp.]|nr:hypothetical protein [Fretibacterium sp.]
MREIIRTVCRGQVIHLLWQPEEKEIEARMEEGFVPVEMAEGTRSYVDFRCLDHHNGYSNLPSACVTALKFCGDLAGQTPARIMVNHTDSDSVMTGLTLLGLLPRELLEELNPEIGQLDTEPLMADESKMRFNDEIRIWKECMESVKQSGWSWLYGLQLWLDIFENRSSFDGFLEEVNSRVDERKKAALEDYQAAERGPSGRVLLVNPSRVKGFDIQFCRETEAAPDTLNGWRHWCVISYVVKSGSVMLACPCRRVAELAFGPGGLENVFPLLPAIEGREWGGRESVGGSPRGVTFPEDRLAEVLETVEGAIRARTD